MSILFQRCELYKWKSETGQENKLDRRCLSRGIAGNRLAPISHLTFHFRQSLISSHENRCFLSFFHPHTDESCHFHRKWRRVTPSPFPEESEGKKLDERDTVDLAVNERRRERAGGRAGGRASERATELEFTRINGKQTK